MKALTCPLSPAAALAALPECVAVASAAGVRVWAGALFAGWLRGKLEAGAAAVWRDGAALVAWVAGLGVYRVSLESGAECAGAVAGCQVPAAARSFFGGRKREAQPFAGGWTYAAKSAKD